MCKLRKQNMKHTKILFVAFIIWLIASLTLVKIYGQTKYTVREYIEQSGIKHPDIVFQQVLKETGHLKCNNCSLRFNNLFGFRYNHKYLKFDKWQDSIDYYVRWQIRKGYDGGDYYEFLIEKWGAPEMHKYIRTLKQIRI